MKQRILVSLLLIPPVLGALWEGGVWWTCLVGLVATLGGVEFYGLMRKGGYRPSMLLGIPWLILLVFSHWQPSLLPLSLLLTAGFIATFIYALFQTQQPIISWTITVVGAIYIGMMLGQAVALRLIPNGLWWMFFALLVTWANDTFAFVVGVSIGNHKLWPRLSPKKSWEGTIAGWLSATLVGVAYVQLTPVEASLLAGALMGFSGGVLALCGDLSISLLKRQVGAKDSGVLMPGHGGILDRLDSLLFVIPFVYQVAVLLN